MSATRRDRSLRGAVVLVRAGSTRHREPPVLAGHERSRPVWTTTARSAFATRSTADEVLWPASRSASASSARATSVIPDRRVRPEKPLDSSANLARQGIVGIGSN